MLDGLSKAERYNELLYSLHYSKVAGVTFANDNGSSRQEAIKSLRGGDKLVFLREPHNKHDRNAVAILTLQGDQIGHLSREWAEEIAPFLNDGYQFLVAVANVTGGGWFKNRGCNIVFRLASQEEQMGTLQLVQATAKKHYWRGAGGCLRSLIGLAVLVGAIWLVVHLASQPLNTKPTGSSGRP